MLHRHAGALGYGAASRLRKAGLAALFLGLPAAAPAEPPTVAALGDSLIQASAFRRSGFVPQLQAWLTDQGHDIAVLNAGVSGDTTAGGLARVDWTLTEDVDAMIVALGGNDLLRGLDPAMSRANLDGILNAAQTRELPVLLVAIEAPGNYGPDYKAAFDAIFPDLAETHGANLHPGFFPALLADTDEATARTQLMQADGIHPNAEGVAKIVADIGPYVVQLLALSN